MTHPQAEPESMSAEARAKRIFDLLWATVTIVSPVPPGMKRDALAAVIAEIRAAQQEARKQAFEEAARYHEETATFFPHHTDPPCIRCCHREAERRFRALADPQEGK